jgi:transposase-like protein
MNHSTSDPFPCPFCRSRCVSLIGAARAFLHYQCSECEEVWTAMSAPAPAPRRRPIDPAFARVSKEKTTLH